MSIQPNLMRSLLDSYEGFLIDIWGVVHDGINPYPGVVDCLNEMIRLDKKILFFSNAPRPGASVIQKLIQLGIRANESMIISSGDLFHHQLANNPLFSHTFGKIGFHWGASKNQDIETMLADHQVKLTLNLKEADYIISTIFIDPEESNLEQQHQFLQEAQKLHLPMHCLNPDTIIMHGENHRYCAGFFAEKYELMGGKVEYYGKPHPKIYELAFNRLQEFNITNKSKILCVGDTPETDIMGARNMGMDSLLVLTGNMKRRLINEKDINHADVLAILQTHYQLQPTWIINALSFSDSYIDG